MIFFPKGIDKIRPIQKDILKEIEIQFDKGTKFIIIEAPTGVGKSDVNVTAALYKKGGTVLTTQKVLQDQYDESFQFVNSVKGKNHFPCHQKDDLENCEKGIARTLLDDVAEAYDTYVQIEMKYPKTIQIDSVVTKFEIDR